MVVIKRLLASSLPIFVATICPLMADSTAKVTEAVNDVQHGSAQASVTSPAQTGTVIQDGEYLKTGVKSRAEIELANQSIIRLGANTIFNYSVANNEIDLQAGTVLFSKPKDGKEMTIKTASVTAAVVGTSGFLQLHGKDFIFGLIEGHATLTIGGIAYNVGAGQVLRFNPGAPPQLFSYNIPVFLKSSPLITLFQHPLPNQIYIDREVAEYNNLVGRGFVGAPTPPFFNTDFGGFVPSVPVVAHDSAGSSLHQFNNPPMPPSMSQGATSPPGGPGGTGTIPSLP